MDGCSYGLRSKDAEKTANGNPAFYIEDSITNDNNCTRKSESACDSSLHAAVCDHAIACPRDPGAVPGADNSKTKIIEANQKIPAPGGNLLNPDLHPDLHPNCTRAKKTGTISDKKSGPDASGTILLTGVPGSHEFLKVDPELSGRL